jgi:hypothetical protein
MCDGVKANDEDGAQNVVRIPAFWGDRRLRKWFLTPFSSSLAATS